MYIEIRDGFSINVDHIEAIEREDELTCKVHTHLNSYSSTFPYLVLLQLLEENATQYNKDEESKNIQRQQLNILKELGTFAG